MTIEIKQLVIRAVVEGGPAPQSLGGGPSTTVPAGSTPLDRGVALSREERAAIVAGCVREVLRKLEQLRQR